MNHINLIISLLAAILTAPGLPIAQDLPTGAVLFTPDKMA